MKFRSEQAMIIALSIVLILTTSCASPRITEEVNCETRFAYVGLDGDIYYSDLCGNNATRVTTNARSEHNGPYEIVDGRWILNDEHILLAINNNQVYLVNLDQAATTPIDLGEYALFSPDGSHFLVATAGKINVYDNDGSSTFQISGYAPSWADNNKILFASTEYTGDIPRFYTAKIQDINGKVSLDVGSIRTLGHEPERSGASYDGQFAFFYSPVGELAKNFVVIDVMHNKVIDETYIHLPTISSVGWIADTNRLFLCYGYITYFDSDVSMEYSQSLDQDCWVGTRISWDATGKFYSYLSSDTKTISVVNIDNNHSNKIEWFDEKSDSGIIDGPYLSPDNSYVSLVFQSTVNVYAINGDLLLDLDGTDFIWVK